MDSINNVTGNFSSFHSTYSSAVEVTVLFHGVSMIVIIIIGMVSNTCSCYCICRNRHLHTYLKVNVMSSCIANLIGCVFLLPIRIELYFGTFDSATWILCQAGTFFRTVWDIVQICMLAMASFERYQAVVYPFKRNGNQKCSVVLVILSWSIALILGTISASIMTDSTLYVPCSFAQEFLTWADYDAFLITPLGFALICVITIFYSLILKTLFKHSDVMMKYKNTKTSKVSPAKLNKYGGSTKTSPYTSKNTAESTFIRGACGKNISLKKSSLECTTFSDEKSQDDGTRHGGTIPSEKNKGKATSLSSFDLKVSSGNSSNGNVRRHAQVASLPDIASSSSQTVQVVGMDGSVRLARTNNQQIAGAVCLMTSQNRTKGRRRLELRASKKIAILIGTFMCCWLPLPVFVVCNKISGQTSLSDTSVCVLIVLSTVGCSSFALNPILVAIMNKQLNSAIKNVLKIKSNN